MPEDNVKKIKNRFTEIINENDPWDLISAGAPDDEYDKYINGVVSYVVNSSPSVEDLKKKLLEVFTTNEFKLSDEKMSILADSLLKSLES